MVGERVTSRAQRTARPMPPALAQLVLAAGHELEVVQGDARTAPAQVVELHVALDRAVLGLPRDDVGACPAMERVAVLIAPARGELATKHRVALGAHAITPSTRNASESMTWWCEMRRAWVRWEGDKPVIVETEHAIAARGDPLPSTVGRWPASGTLAGSRPPNSPP